MASSMRSSRSVVHRQSHPYWPGRLQMEHTRLGSYKRVIVKWVHEGLNVEVCGTRVFSDFGKTGFAIAGRGARGGRLSIMKWMMRDEMLI